MALLEPSTKKENKQIRINISQEMLEQVNAYCEFAGIKKPDEFFEKAAEFVMKKDKEWKAYQAK